MYKIFAKKNKHNTIKHKYGTKVTQNLKKSINFDQDNGKQF